LSGGERARVLIAQLMLQPADVLLLDEPTNDLDIPTLEILEESLLEYRGALVLVTHDRYLLDRVSMLGLGRDGMGKAERFADYAHGEEWQSAQKAATRTSDVKDEPQSKAARNRSKTHDTAILEESLLEYRGALVLVTHDRYLLDRVSTLVLGLDGMGKAERFADYSQWEEWQSAQKAAKRTSGPKDEPRSKAAGNRSKTPATAQKKLSYQERMELAGIEGRITEAEQELQIRHKALEDPEVMGDHIRLQNVLAEMAKAQKIVDALYARWAELEQEQG